MKRLWVVGLLVFVGMAGWRAGGLLSSDAMGMAVGVVFGVLASLPASLLILAVSRRVAPPAAGDGPAGPTARPVQNSQPPVLFIAPPTYANYALPQQSRPAYPADYPVSGWPQPVQAARPPRSFTIVGEEAEWVDDF